MATLSQTIDPKSANLFSTGIPELVLANGTNIPESGYAFDAATAEQIFITWRADYYLSGNLTVTLSWYSAAGNTSGDVMWGVQIAALTSGDAQSVLTDSLATAQTNPSTVNGTASGLKDGTVTVTNLDSIAAGDRVQMRIYRDAAVAGDTMAGDAVLTMIDIAYASTAGAGAGNVSNAGASTDNAIARFDLATGQVIQNSPVLIADTTGAITGPAGFTVTASRFIGPATGLRETSGPTDLTIGSILTQQTLKLSGTTIQGYDLLKSYLAADSSAVTTVLTDVCNITLLSGGQTYLFEFFMLLQNSTVTGNLITMNINFTGGVTRIAYDMQAQLTATAAIQAYGAFNTNNQSITFSPASTALYVCKVKGSIVASSNGQLAFRISRATSGNVIAKAGSFETASET